MDRVSHAMNLVGNSVGGKYTLRRVLGVGGMGAVYEAVHAYTNRRVALKILGPEYADSQDATARFLQEAQAPSSIGHPNIVEVLDAGEDSTVGLYLVLEYLEGEDMESAVEHGHLDVPSLLDVTLQLLDALGAAHARGFVHRDIKPANIFLVRDRAGRLRVKLLDFGIARNVSRGLTVGNVVMGTPHYMAPEQAKGLPVDARADLWSVGAMLFHALSGVPPFDGDNPNVIMVNIIMQDAPPLGPRCPELSKTLVHAIDRALAKSPDARWPDAAAMAAQLSAAPERLDGSLKITTTLRNRNGAVSEMRPNASNGTMEVDAPLSTFTDPPPRGGTLGADDPARSGGTLASLPAPPVAVVTPATAPMTAPVAVPVASLPMTPAVAPGSSRRSVILAVTACVVAVGALALGLALRRPAPTPAPTPAPMALRAAPPTQTTSATTPPAAAPVAPPAPTPVTPLVLAPAAPIAPTAPAAATPTRRDERGHRRTRRGDRPAEPSPEAPTEPPRAPRTISGVPVGTY